MGFNENWVLDEQSGEYYAPGTYEMPTGRPVLSTIYQEEDDGFLSSIGNFLDSGATAIGAVGSQAIPAAGRFFGSGPAKLASSIFNLSDNPASKGLSSFFGDLADDVNRGADIMERSNREVVGYEEGGRADRLSKMGAGFIPAVATAPFGGPVFIGMSGISGAGTGIDRLEDLGASPESALLGGLFSGATQAGSAAINLPFLQSTGPLWKSMLGAAGTNAAVNPVQSITDAGIEELATGNAPTMDQMLERFQQDTESAAMSAFLPPVARAIDSGIRAPMRPMPGIEQALGLEFDPSLKQEGIEFQQREAPDVILGDGPIVTPPPPRAPNPELDAQMAEIGKRSIAQVLEPKTSLPDAPIELPKFPVVQEPTKVIQQKSMPRPDEIVVPDLPTVRESMTASEITGKRLAEEALAPLRGEAPKRKPMRASEMPRPDQVIPEAVKQAADQVMPPNRLQIDDGSAARVREQQAFSRNADEILSANKEAQAVYDPTLYDEFGDGNFDPMGAVLDQSIAPKRARVRKEYLSWAEDPAKAGEIVKKDFSITDPGYVKQPGGTVFQQGSIDYISPEGKSYSIGLDTDMSTVSRQFEGKKKSVKFMKAMADQPVWRLVSLAKDGLPGIVVGDLTRKEAVKIGRQLVKTMADEGIDSPPFDAGVWDTPTKGSKGEILPLSDFSDTIEARNPPAKLRLKRFEQAGVLNLGDIRDAFDEVFARRRLRKQGVTMKGSEDKLYGANWIKDISPGLAKSVDGLYRSLDLRSTWAERIPEFRSAKVLMEQKAATRFSTENDLSPYAADFLQLPAKRREEISSILHKVRDYVTDARAAGKAARVEQISDGFYTKLGLNPAEIKAVRGVHSLFERALFHIKESLVADSDGTPAQIASIDTFIKELSGTGYVPRNRAGQSYIVQGTLADGSPYRSQHDSAKQAEQVLSDVRKQGAEVDIRKMEPDAGTPSITPELDSAIAGIETTKGPFDAQVAKGGKQNSFIRHLVGARNVKGYDTDLTDAIIDYVRGVSNFTAAKTTNKQVKSLLDGINNKGDDPDGQPELKKKLEKYIAHNDKANSKWYGRFSSVLDLYSLAGVPMSAFVNLIQAKDVVATASARAGVKGLKFLAKASDHALTGKVRNLPKNVADALKEAEKAGLTQEGSFIEAEKVAQGTLQKTHKVLMTPFRLAETVTRRAGLLTGLLIGDSKGLKGPALLGYGKEFMDTSLGDYSKANATDLEIKFGEFGRGSLKYRKFMINQMSLMRKLALNEGKSGKLALGGLLFGNVMLAGLVGGIPAARTLKGLMEAAGFDLDEEAEEFFGEEYHKAIMYGLPGDKLGVDTSVSAGFGDIAPTGDRGIGRGIFDFVVGPASQVVSRYEQASRASGSDSPERFYESILPRMFRGPIRAYEMEQPATGMEEGQVVRDVKGRPIVEREGPMDTLSVLFGATAPNTRENYQKRKKVDRLRQESTVDENEFNLRIAKAVFSGDDAKLQSVIQELMEYNEEAIQSGDLHRIRKPNKEEIEKKILEMMGGDAARSSQVSRLPKDIRSQAWDLLEEDEDEDD